MARDYEATVRAMLKKAASLPEGHPERETLEERALLIMTRRQFKVALDKDSADKQVHMVLTFEAPYATQKRILYKQFAEHFNLSTLLDTDRDKYHVFGYKSDFEQTEFLYSIVYNQMMAELADLVIPYRVNARRYRTSWLVGFSVKIRQRLLATKKIVEQENEPGAAIVLMDRAQLAKIRRDQAFPDTHHVKSQYRPASSAFMLGQAAGERTQLHDGTGVGNSRREIE